MMAGIHGIMADQDLYNTFVDRRTAIAAGKNKMIRIKFLK
jgi:hypothetical protein